MLAWQTLCPIQSDIKRMQPFPLYTCSLITIGRLTLEIYFFKMLMDDEDSDDNTYQRGQTITILKPRLSLRVI